MSQAFDDVTTDRQLADQIDRAMDDWDLKPTPAERDRIRSSWVLEQRAWLTKLNALPAEERAKAAAEGAAASEATLAEMKRGLVRAEALRQFEARAEAEGERILKLAKERLQAKDAPSLSDHEFKALRDEVSVWAEAQLKAWAADNPVPTLADDERAIRELLSEDSFGI